MITIPISTTGNACSLSLSSEILHEIILDKYNKYKKQYQKDEKTIKPFDKLYRTSLKDNLTDKKVYEPIYDFFKKIPMKKRIFYYESKHKNKIF